MKNRLNYVIFCQNRQYLKARSSKSIIARKTYRISLCSSKLVLKIIVLCLFLKNYLVYWRNKKNALNWVFRILPFFHNTTFFGHLIKTFFYISLLIHAYKCICFPPDIMFKSDIIHRLDLSGHLLNFVLFQKCNFWLIFVCTKPDAKDFWQHLWEMNKQF